MQQSSNYINSTENVWSEMLTEHNKRLDIDEVDRAKLELNNAIAKAVSELAKKHNKIYDLTNDEIYKYHCQTLLWVANNIVLAPQHRKFDIDDNNRDILRFLLYYFNDCPLAEEVFPGRNYKNHKNIMLMGKAGCGKTLMMQIFSEYLRITENPNYFYNLSVTQMVNYYTQHNNLDRYTYNEESSKYFDSQPLNICLNDIGVLTASFYGQDTSKLTNEFLFARNDIWTISNKKAHLTTNLSIDDLEKAYHNNDTFGRLYDRFKTYNIIPMPGESRR